MKSWRKIPVFLLTTMLFFGMMEMPVFAASTSQDGLEVTLATDKESYGQGEQIVATLTVTNTSEVVVTNVSLENKIPEGYKLADGSEATMGIASLDTGETVTLTVTYVTESETELDSGDNTVSGGDNAGSEADSDSGDNTVSGGDNTGSETNPGSGDNTGSEDGLGTEDGVSEENNSSSVSNTGIDKDSSLYSKSTVSANTGDSINTNAIWLSVLMIVVGAAMIVLVIRKKKFAKRVLSIFLTISFVGSATMCGFTTVNAEELFEKTICIETAITIEDSEVVVAGEVKYSIENGENNQKFYTVTFIGNAQNVSDVPELQYVREGEYVEEPDAPSLDSYEFIGWYTDAAGSHRFDFLTEISEDLTLYAKWRLANDNLHDDIIDLGDIENLVSDGVIEVIYGDNGKSRVIDGRFTSKKINSTEDAADVLNSAYSLFGDDFIASASEISFQTLSSMQGGVEGFYRYSPIVNGVPVLGSQIIISTDNSNYVSGLFSSYVEEINSVDTCADISASEAEEIVIDQLLMRDDVKGILDTAFSNGMDIDSITDTVSGNDAIARDTVSCNDIATGDTVSGNNVVAEDTVSGNDGSVENESNASIDEIIETFKSFVSLDSTLLIFAVNDSESPALVYAVDVLCGLTCEDGTDLILDLTYYICANGENVGCVHALIDNSEGATSVSLTAKDLNGDIRHFQGVEENDEYQLKDTLRNLETYKSTSSGFLFWKSYNLPGEIASSFTWLFSERMDKTAISAHANMSEVYDYYKNVLGRDSFNGDGAKIVVSYDYGNNYKNAYWSSALQQMVFGSAGNYAAALDVAGHEFTHAVINYVVGDGNGVTLTYYGESGALNESYADILGSLVENKEGDGLWLIAEDSDGAIRSMKVPSSYDQPEHYEQRYTGDSDNGGVHTNSGIFNLAAYKMMTDNRTSSISNETWAKVFYNSLYRLTTTATFLDARGAVIVSAKALGFNHEEQQAIKDAFDAVGICEPNAIRIVLTWGENPSDLDSHLVGPLSEGSGRFHVYYADSVAYQIGTDSYAADLDYDDITSYGPEVTTIHLLTPGDYYFYVHDYSNRTAGESTIMAASGATVKVYKGGSEIPIDTFTINENSVGIYWNVFKLTINADKSMTIEGIDTYGSYATYE